MSLENIVSGYPSIIFIYFKLISLFKLRKTFFLLVKEIKFVKSHFFNKQAKERKKEREREREKERTFVSFIQGVTEFYRQTLNVRRKYLNVLQ